MVKDNKWDIVFSKTLRSVAYLGLSAKILVKAYLESQSLTIGQACTVGLLSYTAISFFNRKFQNRVNGLGSFYTSAQTERGWLGTWWFGMGNGEWFGFFGHNNNEKFIVPISIIEQMATFKQD